VTEPLDVTTLVVMSNRLDSITREMTNTVIRAARSTTMAVRDFSCSIVSANHEMLSCPEGIPVHVFGAGPSARVMAELHPDFAVGDAFLHNDPYLGGSHAADHQIIVPVLVDGEHVFTAITKAHVVDCGDALATTYMPTAADVYEEGALIFPCVRVQQHYQDVADVIRMCERRIRGFEVWYGDYLAALGAARLAERRLKEYCAAFGIDKVKQFVVEWLDYSERITAAAIRTLPSGRVMGETCLDPFPGVPDGIPLKVTIDIDAREGRITVDLRDNPDCVPNGLNLTETTARNGGISGVINVLNSKRNDERIFVPSNEGAYRRIEVLLRENCVVGIPRHPASCSVATTTVADRLVGMIVTAFVNLGDGVGLAEPCWGFGPFMAVISGDDPRRESYYIFQLFSGTAGGPGGSEGDGWLTYVCIGAGGLCYIDSAEVVEQKNPMVIWENGLRQDSEGAGAHRGAPGNVSVYGPRLASMQTHYYLDGSVHRPRGVRSGGDAMGPDVWIADQDDGCTRVDGVVGSITLAPRQSVVGLSAGGGGYGDPLTREPTAVLEDVIEEWISVERAADVYGVVLSGDPDRWETLTVDAPATRAARQRLRNATRGSDGAEGGTPVMWWADADCRGG
jgi:N-methylhydantoinase B